MDAKDLSKENNMSYVQEATRKANWLIGRESRGPGDLPNALRRLEAKHGISAGALVLAASAIDRLLTWPRSREG